MARDLVLSSGFLAFGAQAGFLAGVEDVDLEVGGLCGTSSGALVGALWLAGMPAREILALLSARRPVAWTRPHLAPWRGLLRLDRVHAELRMRLPATFAGLDRPFGAGVVGPDGFRVVTSGDLPAAVAASCAVPYLFAPVPVDGVACSDGGAVDRLGLAAWRRVRPDAPLVVHLVDRSAGAAGEIGLDGIPVVRSPRSGARLWSLGDAAGAFEATRARAGTVLRGL